MRYHSRKQQSGSVMSRRSKSPSQRGPMYADPNEGQYGVEGRHMSPSRDRSGSGGRQHTSSRKKEVHVSGMSNVASSGKKNLFGSKSGSSVSLRSSSVTSLYMNGAAGGGDVFRKSLQEIKSLSINAKNQCEQGDYDGALRSHNELQQRISVALSMRSPQKEATFRRVAADSSFRMGMIHEDHKKDLPKASALYQDSLEKYRDLRVHLSSEEAKASKMDKKGKSDQRSKGNKANNFKMELTVKISMVLVKLSENYMKQKRWKHALRVCRDALGVVDHGVEKAASSKNIKSNILQDMEELQEIILDNVEIIEERSGLSFQATRGGAAFKDEATASVISDEDTALEEVSESVGDMAVWLGDSTAKLLTNGAESVYDTLDACIFGPTETSSVGSFSKRRDASGNRSGRGRSSQRQSSDYY